MFNQLIASGAKGRSWSPTTTTLSVGVHALLLAGIVWVTSRTPAEATERKQEEVTFVEIAEDVAPPPPPPVTPQMVVAAADLPPAPKGFQELSVPVDPPVGVPEANLAEAPVSAEDFRGIGVAGGRADGVEGAPAPVDSVASFAYEVAVLEKAPQLANVSEVQRTMSRLYPKTYESAGIGGEVRMRFVITEEGRVDPTSITVISSSEEAFAAATTKALERFKFRPGVYKGQSVRVLIEMPIRWQPNT